ncbi:MAG: HlyD family secretion protein [Victivallaceae bacterium]|nr:HlyD family secretion protein [Victivallaceae bacterium]
MWRIIKRNALLATVTLLFLATGGYYFVRHLKPFTQNAFVVANTRPVSVLVEGYITEVHVVNNQFVKAGDPLFSVFRPPYQLKVDQLTHAIAAKEAELTSFEAQLKVVADQIRAKTAVLENDVYLSGRADEMYASEAISQAYAEERQQSMIKSEAELSASKNQEAVIRAQCDMAAAQIRQLKAEKELADIYLEETVIPAMADGYVMNMFISPGGYYHTGDVLCAFAAADQFFVQANFEETDLSGVHAGQTATIWFWQYPGKTFHGVVENINWGAERRMTAPGTGVPVVEKENQWFLLPQRFPVQIRITDPDPAYPLHIGGSAFVELEGSSRLIEQILWRVFQW